MSPITESLAAVAEPSKPYPTLDAMIAWEQGDLDEDGTIELFQHLISNGMINHLQGCYGRQAKALIEAGLCHRKGVW